MSSDLEDDSLVTPEYPDCHDEVYAKLVESSNLAWNTRLDEAQRILLADANWTPDPTATLKDGPDIVHSNISACVQHAEVTMWRATLNDSPANYDAAVARFERVEQIAEALQAANQPTDTGLRSLSNFFLGMVSNVAEETETQKLRKRINHLEATLALAVTSGGIAMLHMRKQRYVAGAYRMRKTWTLFEQAEELMRHPSLANIASTPRGHHIVNCINFGIGLFNYFVSMLPPTTKWIIELLGFEGNRDKAVELLQACSHSNTTRATLSRSLLVGVRFFFDDAKEEAIKTAEELLALYPESVLLMSTLGGLYRRQGDLTRSTEQYERAIAHIESLNAEWLSQFKLVLRYELSTNLFFLQRFAEAIPAIEDFLERSTSENFKAYGSYKLGICYWVTGQKDKIAPLYEKVPSFVRPNMAYDSYAQRKTASFLSKQAFDDMEIMLLRASNALEVLAHEQSLQILENEVLPLLTERNDTADDMAHYLHLKGKNLVTLTRFEEAIPLLQRLLQNQASIKEDKWMIPFSLAELAKAAIAQARWEDATSFVEQAKAFPSGYDFERMLAMTLKKLASRITKKDSSPIS